jgi:hypothetical protein
MTRPIVRADNAWHADDAEVWVYQHFGIVPDEGRLHWVQLAGLGDAFDCCDRPALHHGREHQAGVDAPAVEQHCAGAALAQRLVPVRCSRSRSASSSVVRASTATL